MTSKIAVIGAGNGGFAMSTDLGLAGFNVNLFEFPEYAENIKPLEKDGSITATGEARAGTYIPQMITSDIQKAIEGVEAVLVAVQAPAHEKLAHLLGKHMKPNQLVFLFPGYASSISMNKIWKEQYSLMDVKCAEVMTLPYACRKTSPNSVHVFRRTGKLGIAAFPGKYLDEMYGFFKKIYPDSYEFGNILEVAFCNQNLLVHPTITLLNAGRIETAKGNFDFYADGCTASVEKLIDSLDQEILAVFKKLGFTNTSSKQVCEIRFGMSWKKLQDERKSWKITGLDTLDTRYVTEDVPTGLIFLSSIAKQYSVACPTCDALIHLWQVISGENFWEYGRTMERLGLDKFSIQELVEFLHNGSI